MIHSGYLDRIPPLGALNRDTDKLPRIKVTLVIRETSGWKSLSVIGAIILWRILFRIHPGAVKRSKTLRCQFDKFGGGKKFTASSGRTQVPNILTS